MNATHDMHFGDGFAVVAFYDVHHLVDAQFPAFFAVGVKAGIGAKIAGEHAHVGGLDMEIAVEIGFIAVAFFTYVVGKRADKGEGGALKKQQSFFGGNALAIDYFLSYWL